VSSRWWLKCSIKGAGFKSASADTSTSLSIRMESPPFVLCRLTLMVWAGFAFLSTILMYLTIFFSLLKVCCVFASGHLNSN